MAVTPNYSWPIPVATDYVKDGWDAIADLGNAIDSTVAGLSSGAETVLSSGTFTTQSTLNISNFLSDTYKFYRLRMLATGSTTPADLAVRFRENTTDKATSYYGGGYRVLASNSSSIFAAINNGSALYVGTVENNLYCHLSMDISRQSATSGFFTAAFSTYANYFTATYGGMNTSMTNFTGLSFYATSGTISGNYILTGVK